MRADRVAGSPEDLRKLAGRLDTVEGQFSDLLRVIVSATEAADWDDPKRDQFLDRFEQFAAHCRRYVGQEVPEIARTLRTLAQKLEDVGGVRF